MKNLIKHLLLNNFDEIVEKSLLNCHVSGVHSLMLLDHPGARIRMFITDKEHELWRNTPMTYINGLSASLHPHHCAITLVGIYGEIINWCVELSAYNRKFKLDAFVYNSGITNEKIGFEKVGTGVDVVTKRIDVITVGGSRAMPANEIHTIGAAKGAVVAWIVLEGKEDPSYKPISFSNVELDKTNFDHLYKKPTSTQIYELLKSIDIYL